VADKRARWHSPDSWHSEAGAKPSSFCELDAQNTYSQAFECFGLLFARIGTLNALKEMTHSDGTTRGRVFACRF
jgi:hypothetical protein